MAAVLCGWLLLGKSSAASERSASHCRSFHPPPLVSGSGFLPADILIVETHTTSARSLDSWWTGFPLPRRGAVLAHGFPASPLLLAFGSPDRAEDFSGGLGAIRCP